MARTGASLINQRQPPSLITPTDNERENTDRPQTSRSKPAALALAQTKHPLCPKMLFTNNAHAMHVAAQHIYTHLHAQIRLESREQESSQHCCCINVIKMMRSAQNSLPTRCFVCVFAIAGNLGAERRRWRTFIHAARRGQANAREENCRQTIF